jgi:geranylgeranyl pyrophosphate synthase
VIPASHHSVELPPLLARIRDPLEADLSRRLTPSDDALCPRLFSAMRYATLNGGKRLRPALVIAAAEACGGTLEASLPAASAVELVHAYTLVHDDLPAMDDDNERRGKPTVHVAFDEAIAILAGDALLTLAFAALADLERGVGDAVSVLARRAGAFDLLSGQGADVAQRIPATIVDLERIHSAKTGALFSAAVELGGITAGVDANTRARLAGIGRDLGILFQYRDDLEDGDHAHLRAQSAARRYELSQAVSQSIATLGARAAPLLELAQWISESY